ncbi:serine hydrolase domain-containing protein [Spirillospora sp. NPDC029432]|uniref:serine hydrolase domain-containing protein n=1 Tax=Spirillospora sp. NPDC029432 TaxID=3154599 RepID=UPI003454F2D7
MRRPLRRHPLRRRTLAAGAVTATAVLLSAPAVPAAHADPVPPSPPPASVTRQAPAGFDLVRPSADPVPLRYAPRDLDVTYTHDGRERTLDEYLAITGTQGFVVLDARAGQDIVFERYSFAARDTRFQSWSMAKSFTSAAVGIALDEGRIRSIDEPVTAYLPELNGSGYEGVSIRDLLRMSSGIAWEEAVNVPPVHVAASLGAPLPRMAAQQKRGWEPGSRFEYTSMNTFVLGWLVARATGTPYHRYVEERIWRPGGMESTVYLGNDSNGNNMAYCCYYATDRDFARFGLLYLRGGRANGRQVVPEAWVKESTRPSAPFNDGYGFQWWLGEDGEFEASGLGGQKIWVSPEHDVVIVKSTLATVVGEDETDTAFRAVAAAVARTRTS